MFEQPRNLLHCRPLDTMGFSPAIGKSTCLADSMFMIAQLIAWQGGWGVDFVALEGKFHGKPTSGVGSFSRYAALFPHGSYRNSHLSHLGCVKLPKGKAPPSHSPNFSQPAETGPTEIMLVGGQHLVPGRHLPEMVFHRRCPRFSGSTRPRKIIEALSKFDPRFAFSFLSCLPFLFFCVFFFGGGWGFP